MKLKQFAYSFLILALVGCSTNQQVEQYMKENNISDRKEQKPILPDFFVYHVDDASSELNFSIHTEDFMYARAEENAPFVSKVKISYKIYESLKRKNLIAEGNSLAIDTNSAKKNKVLFGKITLPVNAGSDYILDINVLDILVTNQNNFTLNIAKTSRNSRQNFLLLNEKNKQPVFKNYANKETTYVLQNKRSNNKSIYVNYYNRDFHIARPPHSSNRIKSFSYKPDSTSILLLDSNNEEKVSPPRKGFYHYQTDTTTKEGFTLYRFSEGYPFINTYQTMLEPLRYISQRYEFESLKKNTDTEKAVNDFWIELGGSKERAAKVLQEYYSRVQVANQNFTSYVEGWKTDRGMVYVIYGAPTKIQHNHYNEVWVYGDESNFMTISFTFNKVDNPFTNNDYLLARDEMYRSGFYRAVETWRQGRIYSAN